MVPTPAAAACVDTVIVRAAKTYTMPGSAQITFVEPCTLSAVPGRRFLIEVVRPGVSNPLTSAEIAFGGVIYFGVDDVDNANVLISRVVTPSGVGDLKVTLKGSAGAHVVVRISHVNESLYSVYSPSPFTGATTAKTYTKYFSFESTPSAPHLMTLTNGDADATGAARTYNAEVWLNSQQVVLPSELTVGRAFVTRDVLLDSVNVLQVNLIANQGGKKLSIKFSATDTISSGLTVEMPSDSLVTAAAKVLATAQIENAKADTRLFVNGTEKAVGVSSWSDSLSLAAQDGKNTFVFTANRVECSPVLTVFRDTQAPVVEILSPEPEVLTAPTTQSIMTFVIRVTDGSRTRVFVDGDSVGFVPLGAGFEDFTVQVPLDLGSNGIHFRASDQLGHVTKFKRFMLRLPPGDSGADSTAFLASVPPLAYTEDTGFRSRVSFLYSGVTAVQSGLAETTLLSGREAVIRGRVTSRDFGPLGGVSVRVLNHPELGQTMTRNDGVFDLVVNGGATLVLRFQRAGYLEAQRQVEVPTQDFAVLDDVALIGRSSRNYHVPGNSTKVVEGRFESDANGDRRIWLTFEPGNLATVVLPNGTERALAEYNVRVKEFTVGGDGPETMPAALPPASAYTYCIELSLAEADALADSISSVSPHATAPEVRFSAPIVTYVRDFLGMPVGSGLPSGHYDTRSGHWVADENGRIIKVLSLSDSLAVLDTDGEGVADTPADYDSAGIDEAERVRIAGLFTSGDILWRMRVQHFSLHELIPALLGSDFNANTSADAGRTGKAGSPPPLPPQTIDDPTPSCGCVIETENRVLGESIPLRGSPYSLHYRSSRQPGDRAMRWVRVPLLSDPMPQGIRRVRLVVDVAGRQFRYSFGGPGESGLQAGMIHVFRDWDGTDVYGRRVVGTVPATVRIGWEFGQRYARALPGGATRGFGDGTVNGAGASVPTLGNRDIGTTSWTTHRVSLGAPSMASAGLGGWTITPHHYFDVSGAGTLYLGDGGVRHSALIPVIKRFAGNGNSAVYPSNVDTAASAMTITIPPTDIALGPDGSLYYTDDGADVVGRIWPDGSFSLVTGRSGTYSSNGVSARAVSILDPAGITVGPDGSVFVASPTMHRVFKITSGGLLYCVAGDPSQPAMANRDSTAIATQALLVSPSSIALGPDGSLYIGDNASNVRTIWRVTPDGLMRRYLGNGSVPASNGLLEGKAPNLSIEGADDIVVDAQGNLFFTESGSSRLRMLSPDGMLHNLVAPDHGPFSLALGTDGALYIGQTGTYAGVIRRDSDGTLSTVAGTINVSQSPGLAAQEGIAARAAVLSFHMGGLAHAPDGRLFVGQSVAGNDANGIRVIAPPTPRTSGSEIEYPAQGGREAYVFTTGGRHLRTVDVVTGVVLHRFEYDAGRLWRITDADGEVTTIERNPDGTPTAIIAPFGQRTELQVQGGYLSQARNVAANEGYEMTYADQGLLETIRDPAQHEQRFTYLLGSSDLDDGRLAVDRDAANKAQQFAEVDAGRTRTVTKSSPTGRETTYQVTQMVNGMRQRLTLHPNDSRTTSLDSVQTLVAPRGQVTIETGAAGEKTITRFDGDPRYGLLAPFAGSVSTALPSGLTRTVTRTPPTGTGTISETTTENGRTWHRDFLVASRKLTTTSPAGRHTIAWFDTAGRMTAVGSDGLAVLRLSYAGSRLTDLVQQSRAWHYDYDSWGRISSMRNAFGHTASYLYDAADRDTQVTLPGNRTAGYEYFADGRLKSLRPPGRPPHEFEYTATGLGSLYRPPVVAGAPNPATSYASDADRQLTDLVRPDGGVVHLEYSPGEGQLMYVSHPRDTVQFEYWTTAQPGTDAPSGQLKRVTSSAHAVACDYEYDGPLPTRETWSGAVSGSVARTHDRSFRDSTEVVTVGAVSRGIRYHYDDLDGLLTSVTESPSAGWTYTLHRSAATGFVDSTQLGAGAGAVTSSVVYDSLGQVAELHYSLAGSPLFHEQIERNALGQIKRIAETWAQGTPTVTDYGYDLAGRLDSVAVNGAVTRRYEYDSGQPGNGNRTAERDGSGAVLAAASYDAQDRLESYGPVEYTYTANGELARKVVAAADTTCYAYDALGNLIEVRLPGSGGDTLQYVVDGQNRRVGA
ncbi:MAG: hypothetical protein IT348_01930, partial [Candidatus Eisenbacteria bacterium]|nr:hypothetical protein [Candidatus Eisenbacteria bacterium]